jgi:hypothetical protein
VDIYDESTKTLVAMKAFSASQWTPFSFEFDAPAQSNRTLLVRVTTERNDVAGASAYLDQIEMLRIR